MFFQRGRSITFKMIQAFYKTPDIETIEMMASLLSDLTQAFLESPQYLKHHNTEDLIPHLSAYYRNTLPLHHFSTHQLEQLQNQINQASEQLIDKLKLDIIIFSYHSQQLPEGEKQAILKDGKNTFLATVTVSGFYAAVQDLVYSIKNNRTTHYGPVDSNSENTCPDIRHTLK